MTQDAPISIAVVIPALNEGGNIRALVREVRQIVPAHVVVCDNGSTDNTAAEALAAGVAAVLWVSQRASVDPLMGFTPVLKAFIAAILGGLGSLRGAVAGGFTLGFIEVYLAAFLPPELQEFRDPIGLCIVVVLLLFRPNGLVPSSVLKAVKV